MFNLFDITNGIDTDAMKGARGKDKPRAANDDEVKAYAEWLRKRAGLTELGAPNLKWRSTGKGASLHRYCVGASYVQGEHGYSVIFPGAALVARARVTMETLDESGEIVAAQTLPIEPKKGGVIWSREDVRTVAGKIDKRNPAPIADATPIEEIETPAPIGEIEPEPAGQDAPEPIALPDAPLSVDIAPSDPENATPEPIEADQVAAIVARLDALERALADHGRDTTAVADREAADGISQAPIEAIGRPARTAAHERAIRRAWAERRARREADLHIRIGIAQLDDMRQDRDAARATADRLREGRDAARAMAIRSADRRRRSTMLARDLQRRLSGEYRLVDRANAAKREAEAREAAAILELARLKRDMADPTQPERASDIVQLKRERDQARAANAALQQRAERAERGLAESAGHIDALAGRVARAEAAVRRLDVAA